MFVVSSVKCTSHNDAGMACTMPMFCLFRCCLFFYVFRISELEYCCELADPHHPILVWPGPICVLGEHMVRPGSTPALLDSMCSWHIVHHGQQNAAATSASMFGAMPSLPRRSPRMLARQHGKTIPPQQQHRQFIEFAMLFFTASYRRPYRHDPQKKMLKHSPKSVSPENSPCSQLPLPVAGVPTWLYCAIGK